MLKKEKTMEDYIQCPGDKERVEGAVCSKCGSTHTMTFEFYEQKIKAAMDKAYEPQKNWGEHDLWKYIRDLEKELGLK